ncbi:MAG: arginine--tRNA ligase, partial [Tolumonas sp.]|nr:arginine--tRNA ligase [Tolumonas sp.]
MKAQIQQLLEQTVSSLKAAALIPVELEPRIQVDNTKDKAHGDLATNLAMLLAKPAGKNPRELAQLIIDHLPASTLVAKAEIAGPGFINFFLDSAWLAKQIEAIAASPTAEVKPAIPAQTIVTDYSAPNVAKEMAVHHIRSTVIGDAVTRTLEF